MPSPPDDEEFRSSGLYFTSGSLLSEVEALAVGVRLPIEVGTERSDLFQMNYDAASQVGDNFKNLVNTDHNERLGSPSYGANLGPLISEYQELGDDFESAAMDRIQAAVTKWMPTVQLNTFTSKFVEDRDPGMLRLDISIGYSVTSPTVSFSGRKLNVSFMLL